MYHKCYCHHCSDIIFISLCLLAPIFYLWRCAIFITKLFCLVILWGTKISIYRWYFSITFLNYFSQASVLSSPSRVMQSIKLTFETINLIFSCRSSFLRSNSVFYLFLLSSWILCISLIFFSSCFKKPSWYSILSS